MAAIESNNFLKRWGARLILIAGGFLFAFLILEVSTRLFWKSFSKIDQFSSISFVGTEDYIKLPPPNVLWPGQFGNVKEFSNRTTKNSLSFHDSEHNIEKPAGTFRIVVLGDSFVEAMQVPLENAFHKLIEADLSERFDFPIEVISLGRSGGGAKKSFDFLSSYGINYDPDLVIMEFLSNDLIDDHPPMKRAHLQQIQRKKEYVPELSELYSHFLLLRWSRFNQILALNLARIRQGILTAKYASRDEYGFVDLNLLIFSEEYEDLWKDSWKKTKGFIKRADDLCKKNDSEFLMVAFPEQWRIINPRKTLRALRNTNPKTSDLHWDTGKTDRVLEEFCRDRNIPFFSLLPAFKKAYRESGKRLFFTYDMHLNENGHKVAAAEVTEYLQSRNMIALKPDSK